MSSLTYDQFSFELRQFRLSTDMSRAALASILGISSTTLKKWEDGTSQARTYKLWEVENRLKALAEIDKSAQFDYGHIIGVFSELIENLNLANVNSDELRSREIEKKLTKTILKAAQTDFALSGDRRSLVPVPFTEDLELFRNNRILDIEQLLQSIVANIGDTTPHLEDANINSERLCDAFRTYVEEADRDIPNPRILHRKGEIIRRQVQDQEVRQALSSWDTTALDGFVEDHQELMRMYFGEALQSSQEVERANISDKIVSEASKIVSDAVAEIEKYTANSGAEDFVVDSRISAILVEIEKEIVDYESSWRQANTPSAINAAATKIKNSIKHVGIFLGRFILRVTSFGVRASANMTVLMAAIDALVPGSFRSIYEIIRLSFPLLPPLF